MINVTKDNYKCRICSGGTVLIQTEERGGFHYNVARCLVCETIQAVEHFDDFSPEYINLTNESISPAHIYQSREHKRAAYEQFLRLFERKLILNSNIVDIGCGTGGFGEFIINNGYSYFGFDASLAQVNFAKERGLNAQNANSCKDYMSRNIIATDKVGIVTMWDVLEHVRNPQAFLAEVRSLMNEQSYLFISVPNGGAYSWKRLVGKLFNRTVSYDPWEHVFYYNIKSLEFLLNQSGFRLIESGAVVCYPRKMDLLEALRRFVFKILSATPSITPQIFVIATHRKIT